MQIDSSEKIVLSSFFGTTFHRKKFEERHLVEFSIRSIIRGNRHTTMKIYEHCRLQNRYIYLSKLFNKFIAVIYPSGCKEVYTLKNYFFSWKSFIKYNFKLKTDISKNLSWSIIQNSVFLSSSVKIWKQVLWNSYSTSWSFSCM